MGLALSRQQFLKSAGAFLLALTFFQGTAQSRPKAASRPPSRAACCYGPRALAEIGTPAPSSPSNPLPAPTLVPAPTPVATPSEPPIPLPTPPPVASSWTAPPAPAPAPQPTLAPPPPLSAEEELVQQVQQFYGIRLVLEGQDWGPDPASRLANLGAVLDVLGRLPATVLQAIGPAHRHGSLHILSNDHGRTLRGWQPYGDFPIGYYTNSDRDPESGAIVAANQVILIPGFANVSVGHEVLHAYQFRDVGPDRYALAMLGAEMKGFAQAVGWRQVGSDQEIIDAANGSWTEFNALFVYEGRPLNYVNAGGARTTLAPPNPLEAFAIAGSFYYTRPASVPLPDWPEYWAWFKICDCTLHSAPIWRADWQR